MTFTDEDLMILQAWTGEAGQVPFDSLPHGKLKALLARLEAAEDFIDITESDCDLTPDMKLMLEAWRKSKGE